VEAAARRRAWHLVAAYLIAASAWIIGSDLLLALLGRLPLVSTIMNILKGLAFVGVTSAVLYWRLFGLLRGLETTRQERDIAQERMRRAMIDAPIPAIVFAEDGAILLLNRAWEETTGYSAEELRTIRDWTERAYGEERRFEVERGIQALFELDRRTEEADFPIRIRGGSTRIWSFSSAPLGRLSDGRRVVLSMARDVTERRRAEDALRISEERFRTLVETAPDGIFIQTGGRFRYVNPAALAQFGLPDDSALIGQPVLDWFHPDHQEAVRERIRILLEERRPVGPRIEPIVRADGGRIVVEVTAAPFSIDGEPGALVFMRDVTAREQARDALTQTTEQLRELSHRLMDVQETERRLLARELHDQIGQALTAIKLDLRAVRRQPETAAERLDDATALLDHTLSQVRDLALDLRPAILDDLGLVPALRWYVERFTARSGIAGQFWCDDDDDGKGFQIDLAVATACFRVAQEALTNVAKHAEARHFEVELTHRPDGLRLIIRDDGQGFAREALPADQGLGLSGMRERVEQAGGRLTIRSEPGRGTELRLDFPAPGAGPSKGAG